MDFQYAVLGAGRSADLGFNSALDIRMSPMRFVYVQQYWLKPGTTSSRRSSPRP